MFQSKNEDLERMVTRMVNGDPSSRLRLSLGLPLKIARPCY